MSRGIFLRRPKSRPLPSRLSRMPKPAPQPAAKPAAGGARPSVADILAAARASKGEGSAEAKPAAEKKPPAEKAGR